METKKLSFQEMEEIEGGWCLKTSHAVCGGLGAMFSFANPFLGIGVGLWCSASWDDLEGSDPALFGTTC
ncbi:MAG: hypothetical protein R6U58_05585 [Bacteroidales bacterium]